MINCTITSDVKTDYYKGVQTVTLPAHFGQIQVLPGHAESFILLNEGEIIIEKSKNKNKIIKIEKGEVHIKNDSVTVIL